MGEKLDALLSAVAEIVNADSSRDAERHLPDLIEAYEAYMAQPPAPTGDDRVLVHTDENGRVTRYPYRGQWPTADGSVSREYGPGQLVDDPTTPHTESNMGYDASTKDLIDALTVSIEAEAKARVAEAHLHAAREELNAARKGLSDVRAKLDAQYLRDATRQLSYQGFGADEVQSILADEESGRG